MKFYTLYVATNDVEGEFVESYVNADGQWATRADAEQLEKERDAYRVDALEKSGMALQAMCDAEQAAKDAVAMARLVQANIKLNFRLEKRVGWEFTFEWQQAQAIIERYEGGKKNE